MINNLNSKFMKKNIFYSFVIAIAIASFAFMACSSNDDDGNKQMKLPEKAQPSTNFTLGSFDNEQYADDAIKMDVTTWGNGTAQEFKSIELFADGHFLMTKPQAGIAPKRGRMATRAVNMNGTIEFDKGLYVYGTFSRVKDGVYSLSNNTKIEINKNGVSGNATITYTNSKGEVFTVVVNININSKPDDALRQICRSWKMDSSETWLFTDNAYIGYGKQWLDLLVVKQDFTITPEGKKWGFDEDDILDDKDDYCRRVIFSPCGTAIYFYVDGEVEVGRWEWKDKLNGVLRCWEPMDLDDDDYDDDDEWMDMTIRFDGKQMRAYTDYIDVENNVSFHAYNVSTFSAKY